MGELTELALATISQAQTRVEVAGQNLANATTSAFKKRVAFVELVRATPNDRAGNPVTLVGLDDRPGKLVKTGNASDLALAGPGFFALSASSETVYERGGQFTIDSDGRLVNSKGFALQFDNGRDVVVATGKFEIAIDGTVSDKGEKLGRIAVYMPLAAPTADALSGNGTQMILSDKVQIVQGAFEASNVVSGDEMVAMVEALRRAESGQRVMNVYDDLMGRVINVFGESAR